MPDDLDRLIAAGDLDAWRAVPAEVARLVRRWADDTARTKAAGEDFLRPLADALAAPQALVGGPNPLTRALVGGVIGSGLGYGGGYLAEKLTGLEPGRLRRTAALAGAGLGAAPGVISGLNAMANPAATGGGLAAWTSRWPAAAGLDEPPGGNPALDVPAPTPGVAPGSRFDARVFRDPHLKLAALPAAGAFYLPTIPVDAFNRALWGDVRPANPFGTKSPWGDDDQPLGTPPPAAAAVSGLVAGAAAATGRPYVSPYHVALAAGVAGGKGYLAGTVAGKVLGALAGLPPPAQAALRQAGLWGGIVAGVAEAVFGGD